MFRQIRGHGVTFIVTENQVFPRYLHSSSTVCVHLESPAPASKELLKIILMILQHHSATKKTWLNNPQGFGMKGWELPELRPLFSQAENSTVHTSQGGGIWVPVKSSPSPPFPAQNTGSDTRGWKESPLPRPSCLQPWVQPSYGIPQTAVPDALEIRDDQHGKPPDPLI